MHDNQTGEGELAKEALGAFKALDAEVQQDIIDLLRYLSWTE